MEARGCCLRGVLGFRAFDAYEAGSRQIEELEAPSDTCNGLWRHPGTDPATGRCHADEDEEQAGHGRGHPEFA